MLTITVPEISLINKSIYQYEEGFFVTYPYKDSSYLYIHYGYNVTKPFCDTTNVKKIVENDTIICYYGTFRGLFNKEIFFKEKKNNSVVC